MNIAVPVKAWFLCFFLMSLIMNDANAINKKPRKKFENPALQFEGTWQVISYDFREFEETPSDFEEQLKEKAGGFPIGQRIHFVHTGSIIMPGTIDPITMTSPVPSGESMQMTLLMPYSEAFCKGYWSYVCEGARENYQIKVMITNIYNWKKYMNKNYVGVWDDILPLEYGLQSFSKSYGFDVWFTYSGEMMMVLTIDGKVIVRGQNSKSLGGGIVGVRLRRVDD